MANYIHLAIPNEVHWTKCDWNMSQTENSEYNQLLSTYGIEIYFQKVLMK